MSRGLKLAVFAAVLLAGSECALRFFPIPEPLFRPPVQSIALLDRNGIPLREARVENRFSRELRLDEVPRHVIDAVLAAEDKRFFAHHGVDWIAATRASASALRHGRISSGASTITQQLVKITTRRPRTWRTKFSETLTAIALESRWSKEKILIEYLNRLDFGNLNVGLASAADYYFGKPVADLSEAEAALLAGIPKNPRKLNPHSARAAAERRQRVVLRRLYENGAITAAQFASATAEPLNIRPSQRRFRAPHFADLVLTQPLDLTSPEVHTTLDISLNDGVQRIVREKLSALREQNVRNTAAVVIDNRSGDVLALVGSENYFAAGEGQVNGAWAKRSAGSTLKPFTYLLALERGDTPATIVADVRTSFAAAGGFYRPENYNRRCYGPVRYRVALANSLNIPAVKVLERAGGPAALHERLRVAGLTTLDKPAEVYGLGLTLGNCEARLLELTNAYAALARLGDFRPYRLTNEIPHSGGRRFSKPEYAWQIADILSDNAARALSFGMNSALRFEFPVACKTGTSTDFRDNWAIGFTPEFSVGVWVGNFDGAPMQEVSGVTGAGPILHDVFERLHSSRGTSWYKTPANIVERAVHPLTGKVVAGNASTGVLEKFVATQLPPGESPNDYDRDGVAKLSQEYDEWLASAENTLRGSAAVSHDGLRVTSPLRDSAFVIDPDIRSSARIPLIATGSAQVVWTSDSLRCEKTSEGTFAVAREGRHRIVATDPATGRRVETWIAIREL